MNLKKMLLSLLMGFTVLTPAMARNNSASTELTIIIPPAATIQKIDEGAITTSVATRVSPNKVILSTPLSPKYEIVSNSDMKIRLSATSNTKSGDVSALQANGPDSMLIVFTKSDGSASAASVKNCMTPGARADENPNAIAFVVNCNKPLSLDNAAANMSINNDNIIYDIGSGKTILSYSISGSSVAGTFSPDDTIGAYKSTLTVSDIVP